MKRIAFCRLLPIIAVCLVGACILQVQAERRLKEARAASDEALLKWGATTGKWEGSGKLSTDVASWDEPVFFSDPGPQLSRTELLLAAVAAPGLPLALVLTPLNTIGGTGLPSRLGLVLGSGIAWFLIGRWLDRILADGGPPRPTRLERMLQAYGTILVAVSPLALLVFVVAFFLDEHITFFGGDLIVFAVLFFWSCAGTAVTWRWLKAAVHRYGASNR